MSARIKLCKFLNTYTKINNSQDSSEHLAFSSIQNCIQFNATLQRCKPYECNMHCSNVSCAMRQRLICALITNFLALPATLIYYYIIHPSVQRCCRCIPLNTKFYSPECHVTIMLVCNWTCDPKFLMTISRQLCH